MQHLPRCEQRWRDDFRELIAGVMPGYAGWPYAFVRYGDGEAAIISGRKYQTRADGWKYPGGTSEISNGLASSLCCNMPGYYVGLPSPTFELKHLQELLPLVRVPADRITWSKIFIDTNYRLFRDALPHFFDHCVTVASSPNAHFFVPPNGVNPYWGDRDLNYLVGELQHMTRPILVSAGPLTKIIIHRYWSQQPVNLRQVILDVGSAIDACMKGRTVRKYSHLQHRSRDWAPFLGGMVDV